MAIDSIPYSSSRNFESAYAGLWGYDMITLLNDCVIAQYVDCSPWMHLSGWAIGVGINISLTTSNYYGICFDSTRTCVFAQGNSNNIPTVYGSFQLGAPLS